MYILCTGMQCFGTKEIWLLSLTAPSSAIIIHTGCCWNDYFCSCTLDFRIQYLQNVAICIHCTQYMDNDTILPTLTHKLSVLLRWTVSSACSAPLSSTQKATGVSIQGSRTSQPHHSKLVWRAWQQQAKWEDKHEKSLRLLHRQSHWRESMYQYLHNNYDDCACVRACGCMHHHTPARSWQSNRC